MTDPRPRLYRRANLRTPDAAPPGHDALATIGDRIVAVGTEADCRAALPSDAEVVDLAGKTLAPGFVDAHLHPLVMCVFEQQLVLDRARSLADVLDAVADKARSGPRDRAVMGFALDDELLAERRLPTAEELEQAGNGRHVVLMRRDGHHAVASSSALEAVGLAAPGTDPEGGHVERDAAGRPTGLVRETAVAPLMSLMADPSFEDLESGLDAWRDRLLRQGVTAISAMCQTTDEGPGGSAAALEAIGWSVLIDRVPFDVQTILIAPDLAAVHEARTGPLHRPEDGRRVDAVKLFLDGTLGGRTACMHQPFSDHAGAHGLATLAPDEARRRITEAHVAGLQVCIHAIGDKANRQAADLLGEVLAQHPGPYRHRVEHASVLDDVTIERFAEHGISAVVQPINLRSERHWLDRRVGPERLELTYPYRRLLDAGVTVAGSSDGPIESTDVIAAMGACTDRRGISPAQEITGAEALALYTTGGSAVRRTEDRLGRLAPGLRADLVVLDGDPAAVANTAVADLTVLATVIGGIQHHGADLADPTSTPGASA
jgi:predicted amidohydrolase YtcJ